MRTFYFLTVMMVLLMIATVGIKAQSSTIDIGNVDPAYKGQVITVPISVHNFISVGAYQFKVNFNPGDLELVKEVDSGSPLYNIGDIYATDMATANTNGGHLTIAWASATTMSHSDGTLLELKFYVLSTASSPSNITVTDAIVATAGGGNMLLGSTDGKVTIYSLQTPTIQKIANGTKLDLYCENFISYAGFNLTLTYDAVKYTGTPTITFPNAGITGTGYLEKNVQSGKIVIAWIYSGYPIDAITLGTNGSGVLASIDFGQTVTVSASDFPSLTATARTTEAVPKDMVAGPESPTATMKLGTVLNAVSGSVVTIPILVTNFNNLGAFQFTINFNSSKLELAETPSKTLISGGIMTSSVGLDPNGVSGPNPWDASGTLTIAWASGTPINFGDGTLMNLKFKVLQSTATSADFDNLSFSPGSIVVDQNGANILKAGYPAGGKIVFQQPGTPTFTLGSGTVAPGGTINLPITTTNFIGVGFTIHVNVPANFTISNSDITYPDAVSSIGYVDKNVNGGTDVALTWIYTGAATTGSLPDNSTVANLVFHYTAGSTTVGSVSATFASATMRGLVGTDPNGLITATTTNGTITFTSPAINVKAKVLLQGPNSGGVMTTALNSGGLIPLNSATAYNATTFGYTAETVTSIPNANVVDWVLVELRTGTASSTKVETQPAFLLKDGSIVDVNGSSDLAFSVATTGSYYIVVRHRNHLAVISSTAVSLPNGTVYDLGIMTCGDTDGSGVIDVTDRANTWNARNTSGVYDGNDTDLSGVVDVTDRANTWNNRNLQTLVP